MTWGCSDYGSDSSSVQDQLKNVQQVQATSRAFVAILRDGSVVTWGVEEKEEEEEDGEEDADLCGFFGLDEEEDAAQDEEPL